MSPSMMQSPDPETYWKAPECETSWDNPSRPERWKSTSWFERVLCRVGLHESVYDGSGWDGGYHCARCGTNWN